MKPEDFTSTLAGRCSQAMGAYWAFHPNPLPPSLELDWKLAKLLSEADLAMAELSGAGQLLPNPHLLIWPFLRREAISSSRIENTIAEMEELALFEADPDEAPQRPDVREVANYVSALETGLHRMRELPISNRLIRELHEILLGGVRGGEITKTPGEYRRSQNWIGPPGCKLEEATYVPPPPEDMLRAMGEWEKYLHSNSSEPMLVKCALLHYQFEAIHPFLDGNGRIGRLLITLFLCSQGGLSQPLLYLSGFFDETRNDYYRYLLAVSRQGAWRDWVEYFLRGVRQQARIALAQTQSMLRLQESLREMLKQAKRPPQIASRILEELFKNPVFSIGGFCRRNSVKFPTVSRGVKFWVQQGLLEEFTGKKRNRFFLAKRLLDQMLDTPKPAPSGPSEGSTT
ncbi:MAG TPA: Fic family protein [Candidatus Hydrogenedentes bacterium]|nr:Fic family protein [Candidatus Hydrogenedentota bacterium]